MEKRNIRKEVLRDIDSFLKEHPELNRSAFGRLVSGNHKLVRLLEKSHCSTRTIDKIYNFMAKYNLPKKIKSKTFNNALM